MVVRISEIAGRSTQRQGAGLSIGALWGLLWLLVATLVLILIVIVIRMDLFSTEPLGDEELKALWTFLAAMFAAVVTLIGTLFAERASRQTAVRDQQTREDQDKLARQAEHRLALETAARLLELIAVEGGYAPKAKVAGAIATLIHLQRGTVAIRILGELWSAKAIDTDTAVWLVDRVLVPTSPSDVQLAAAELLASHADALVPSEDDQAANWIKWPRCLHDSWPKALTAEAQNILLLFALRTLTARKPSWWPPRCDPLHALLAYWRSNARMGPRLAALLGPLVDHGFVKTLELYEPLSADEEERLRRHRAAYGHDSAAIELLIPELTAWVTGSGDERRVLTNAFSSSHAVHGLREAPEATPA